MGTQDIFEMERRLTALESAGGSGSGQCTAENPHDQLSWDRRVYRCRCGKLYHKDGFGGLREVSSGS